MAQSAPERRWANGGHEIATVLATVPGLLAGGLIGAITLLLLASVIGRYSGLYTIVWAEEASRAMFLWMVLLGAAAAIERGGHFRLDVVEKLLPPSGQRLMRILAQAAMVLLGLGLIVTGLPLLANSAGQFTNALGLPLTAVNAAIPFGGVLMCWYALRHLRLLIADPGGER
ncbi:MAG: TRAP transporter small permease [Alphaproteobacteria bacterium]|nr:TRAP transporter small permease [Alphaproteobacteria bacterium]